MCARKPTAATSRWRKSSAALIGVPSDEVYRRAERERRRQARIRNAVAAVILVLFSAGSYFGWRSYTAEQSLTDIEALVNQYAPIGSAEAQPVRARATSQRLRKHRQGNRRRSSLQTSARPH